MEMLGDPDPVKVEKTMAAMMTMVKIDIAGLKRAWDVSRTQAQTNLFDDDLGRARFWDRQFPAFDGKIRVISADLPGHGRSDPPKISYTMDLFARAIDAVLNHAGCLPPERLSRIR